MDRQTQQPLDAGAGRGGEQIAPLPPRKFTRRDAITYGLVGAGGLAAAGALTATFFTSTGPQVSAEVFTGDAPGTALWEQWLARGWAREARHYLRLGGNVRCVLCPNACMLAPGDRGRCRNRVNVGGKLYTLVYGNPCALNVDPIEKKPLFHYLPGSRVFSLATSGCGFRCLNCQNWDISQRKPEQTKDPRGEPFRLTPGTLGRLTRADVDRMSLFPQDVVDIAAARGCPGIAYTYSEPTMFFEYMADTARLARERGIRNVWVTCGYIQKRPLAELCDWTDAANVDLKSFDDRIYRTLNSGSLQPILDTLVALKERGVWSEITNLVVPTYTDKPEMIRRMCGWMLDTLGPDVPLHFSRFHPRHKLAHLPPTPPDFLQQAKAIAVSAGLHYVYIGNIRGIKDAETTFCPACNKPVIERTIYTVTTRNLKDGKCRFCGEPIAGVW